MADTDLGAPESLPTQTNSPTNRGIVYVLTNDAMPGFVKVGETNGDSPSDVLRRMKELSGPTGVPLPFNCEYAAVVENYKHVEQTILKDIFGDRRVANREFLDDVSPPRVKAVLQLIAIDDVTPGKDDGDNTEQSDAPLPKVRADNFRFWMARVPVGATIQWAENQEIEAEVVNDRQIRYEDELITISKAARAIKGWSSARGSYYWLYKGETLQECRDRFEAAEDDN